MRETRKGVKLMRADSEGKARTHGTINQIVVNEKPHALDAALLRIDGLQQL